MVNDLLAARLDSQLRRAGVCLCLAWSVLLAVGVASARAETPSLLALNWVRGDGAESCVSARELGALLQETLAADNVVPGMLSIEGWVQRDQAAAQWRARLRVLDAQEQTIGMRELSSADPSCSALTPSVVLVLAILVELGSDRRPAPPAHDPATTAGECPAPSEQVPLAPARAPTPKPAPTRWFVEPLAALTLTVGLLPGASVGPQLGVHVLSPWPVSLLAHGGYWPGGRSSIDAGSASSASVDFRAYHGDLSLCLSLPRLEAFRLAGCWGAALGARHAEVTGLLDAQDSVRRYLAATATALFGYAVSKRLSLRFETSFLGFGREDRYTYVDENGAPRVVFHAGRFAGLFALGLGIRL